ncbi:hypothetical protein POV26_06240 [Aequorivita todarodis]|uniref:hypothetical protein n=1 Tax=Aequorivita todarodis TaxID=2036821 RepID=UPI002350ABAC|nr:hypothetical protein [Aequorivita todarodis]MDC8000627.1 hypothetical protein [Aequorivita todarodis]
MKNLKRYKLRIAVFLLLLLGAVSYSQKNRVESFNVVDDVEVSVNTSYTNIVFETWNKNKVEVEAYIEDEKLSEKEKQQLMKNWDLNISGNSKKVSIASNAGNQGFAMDPMPPMDFIGPLMENMVLPMIQNIQVPPLPEGLFEDLGNIQFDYEAYQKDEKGYMKKFEAEMDKRFGKDFEEKMEAWGQRFDSVAKRDQSRNEARREAQERRHEAMKAANGKRREAQEKRDEALQEAKDKRMDAYEKRMEAYGERMEAWGEEYGKRMEAWANEIERNYEKENGSSIVIQRDGGSMGSGNAKKTIIIRLPKNAKTNVNIRHGNLKMADVNNVKANLDYTPFKANSIDGGQTSINASYASVQVNTWKQGMLNLKFVDQCSIDNVQNINLQANSSDVRIGNVTNQAFLSGSFGDLSIAKISNDFETIDINLENTDAQVKAPVGAFSFYFNGRKSTLKYPKSLQLKESKSADRILVKGYNQNNSSNKTITINSTYSNVSLQ